MHAKIRHMVLAAILTGAGGLATSPAQAQAPGMAIVQALDAALDAGAGEAVLAVVAEAVGARPADASAVVGTAVDLAPWMATDVVARALQAVPAAQRATLAPDVLAAALVAGQGRLADAVLQGTRQEAPEADAALLDHLAARLSVAGGGAQAALADLAGRSPAADRPDARLTVAIVRARAAVRHARLLRERAVVGPWQAVDTLPPSPTLSLPAEDAAPAAAAEPRLGLRPLIIPRLPDPAARPSPS